MAEAHVALGDAGPNGPGEHAEVEADDDVVVPSAVPVTRTEKVKDTAHYDGAGKAEMAEEPDAAVEHVCAEKDQDDSYELDELTIRLVIHAGDWNAVYTAVAAAVDTGMRDELELDWVDVACADEEMEAETDGKVQWKRSLFDGTDSEEELAVDTSDTEVGTRPKKVGFEKCIQETRLETSYVIWA